MTTHTASAFAAKFDTETLARYTDESLLEGRAGMHIRAAKILVSVLTEPADRAEAASRAFGLMNRLGVRYSQAVSLAAHQVRDGDPTFVDEYHPNGPTAPVR